MQIEPTDSWTIGDFRGMSKNAVFARFYSTTEHCNLGFTRNFTSDSESRETRVRYVRAIAHVTPPTFYSSSVSHTLSFEEIQDKDVDLAHSIDAVGSRSKCTSRSFVRKDAMRCDAMR